MPQEYRVQEALRLVLLMQKDLRDFFGQAARLAGRDSATSVFQRLGREIDANIESYFHLYHGQDLGSCEEFLAAGPSDSNQMLQELTRERWPEMQQQRARQMALEQEADIARRMQLTAAQIIDPAARQLLLQAAATTESHLEVVESEYARSMGMVHESDIDTYVRE